MKIAIIKDGPFLPIKDGACYKVHNYVLEYQKKGLDVFFVLIDRGWIKEKEIINSGIKKFILIPPKDFYGSTKLSNFLLENNIEAIQTNIPELIINKKNEWKNFKVIFDSHDVLFEQSLQNGESKFDINVNIFIDYFACEISDLIFCCTQRDKKKYEKFGIKKGKIHVVKNCCVKSNEVLDRKYDDRILFLGHLFYEPNLRAVNKIFSIAKKLQNYKFDIVGDHPKKLENNCIKNVHFLGYKKNIHKVISKYRIGIVPLDRGSGSKIKILDYLTNGLQVISTSLGLKGLEDLNPFTITEDDFSKFPRLIEKLNSNYCLNVEGKKYVDKNYSYEEIIPKIIPKIKRGF